MRVARRSYAEGMERASCRFILMSIVLWFPFSFNARNARGEDAGGKQRADGPSDSDLASMASVGAGAGSLSSGTGTQPREKKEASMTVDPMTNSLYGQKKDEHVKQPDALSSDFSQNVSFPGAEAQHQKKEKEQSDSLAYPQTGGATVPDDQPEGKDRSITQDLMLNPPPSPDIGTPINGCQDQGNGAYIC